MKSGADIGNNKADGILAAKVSGYSDLAADDVVTVSVLKDSYVITKCASISGTKTAVSGATPGAFTYYIDGTALKMQQKLTPALLLLQRQQAITTILTHTDISYTPLRPMLLPLIYS
jgi:hypothetical protein